MLHFISEFSLRQQIMAWNGMATDERALKLHIYEGHKFTEAFLDGEFSYPPEHTKDTASYQRDVYRITQPLGAFFFISHTVLSLVESKGKWKWRKAQLVSHGMRGSF